MSQTPRKPRAFAVDEDDAARPDKAGKAKASPKTRSAAREPRAIDDAARVEMAEEDFFATEHLPEATAPPPPPRRRARRFGLAGIGLSALGVIVTLALGLWLEQLVRDLFERHPVLGQAGLVAIGLLALALVAFIAREIWAIANQRSIAGLRAETEKALADGNARDIAKATGRLEAHFASHPKTATGRAHLADLKGEVIDAADRHAIAERALLAGLDAEARTIVMNAAKRVSVVTALSPRAFVDLGYVLFENVRLIRTIAEHYGGRAGTFGTIALVRRVVSHLAVTGTIALGDSLIQQLVGHGVAARLSARLGEGVVNGLMTARVGISAIGVCRPAPFEALPAPRVGEMARTLTRFTAAQQGETDRDDKNGAS
ncbi:MAG: TIGR01620 family protein [Roseitalea sp.]|nr:TIGR01620 family protein [Roseitalea sp.]MBO6950532.1 TIGR01620 family protein [Rhizobiaceae bacterium]MBO6591481.1 TIGR01620 family protein [Roseitalea sp.]MBO6599336.1 TIGR01620 family protein [Roseitalea sp.]MBO6612175.1 TIGR01620 family protein [Roseitalea sp.]